MKRVLLTGGSGFIGARVLNYLLKNTGWRFTCVASWRHHGNPERITSLPNYKGNWDHVQVVTHDLRGPLPDYGEFDYIINMASESHVDRSIEDPVPFIENNVTSTLMMLEYARAHPPKVFLQFSTDEVWGADADHTAEWGVTLPSNPYAGSKAAQEAICISYWRTYGVPLVITNTNNVVGPGQDPEKFVPRILRALVLETELQIHTHHGEMGTRFYNPVDNVADALLFILQQPVAMEGRPDRYNLSGGTQLSNLELAQRIAELANMPLKYRLVEVEGLRPGYDVHYASAKGRLEELGWTPPVTLTEGLMETVGQYVRTVLKGTA